MGLVTSTASASGTDTVSTVVLLGSTGSIGTQAIDVIMRNPERFRVRALSAGGGDLPLLAKQALDLNVEAVGVADDGVADKLREIIQAEAESRGRTGRVSLPEIVAGPDASATLAALPCDAVLNGITKSVGLAPTLAALRAGSRLILANKESIIVGGPLVKREARPGQIIPADSEHSALFQCLQSGKPTEVRRLIVTASGGPFRGRTRAEMADVTPEQALNHPVWAMGAVNTINSANLVNKGLEVIEAHLLFDIPLDRIEVVVHPQVMVHSMVEFVDGSTIAQVSVPDMRLPLSLGLGWPDRVADAIAPCDWTRASTWEFLPVDHDAFPALRLAYAAGQQGGTAPAVFNAANEECIAAFVAGRISFTGIADTVARIVDLHEPLSGETMTLDDVLGAEQWARRQAHELTGL